MCVPNAESKVDWLSVSVLPPGSNSPSTLQYAVQPNLSFQPRSAAITVGDQSLTISQEAGPKPGIAGPSSLDWVVPERTAKTEKKILHIGCDDPGIVISADSDAKSRRWLSIHKNGSDERNFEVVVNVRDLKAGNYTGQIVVHAAGARNDPLSIPVNVKVLP